MFSEKIVKWQRLLEKATPQVRKPALIGAAVLFVLFALAMAGLARTENPFVLPSSLQDEQAVSFHVWGLKQRSLLMVLPIGAFLVVLARSFIGLKAFGLFTPMLIALAFLQMGPIIGPMVLLSSIGVGMAVAPQLLRLRMTRVGFLGVLISFVVFVLAAAQQLLDEDISVDAFPVVVCALCVERWWKQWEKDGAYASARMALNTLVLALAIQFIMVSHIALLLIDISPLVLPSFAAIAITILGRYRGLRMTELARFAPIWLEERRSAKDPKPADDNLAELVPQGLATGPSGDPARARDGPGAGPKHDHEPGAQDFLPRAGLAPPDIGRDPRHQPEERDHRQIQSPRRDRASAGQGRSEGGAGGTRRGDDGDDLRRLRIWTAQ